MLSNGMKIKLLFLFFAISFYGIGQQVALKKGGIIDQVSVNDSINETFALYLPTTFEVKKEWPVVFVFDMQGRGKQALSMFRKAADKEGFVLAASNNIQDTLTLTKNVLIASRMISKVYRMLPIRRTGVYTGGYGAGARMASLIPTFIKEIQGVISCGSSVANSEVLTSKRPFHFVGIVGVEDYNYRTMKSGKKLLYNLKFPNELLVFDGGEEWPTSEHIAKAMQSLKLAAMAKKYVPLDENYIAGSYNENIGTVNKLLNNDKPLLAYESLNQTIELYRHFRNTDSLKSSLKTLKRTKEFKVNSRSQNAAFFKEDLIKDDYVYYLAEDIQTYNYNNLGWWQFQMEELEKYSNKPNTFEKQMAARLKGFINALIADNIDEIKSMAPVDEEAVTFLWMLKTITDAEKVKPYLKVISRSSKVEDYGTALFYLEELFKTGYDNKVELYKLEDTALLRITPEFNDLVSKYLK